MDKVVIAAEHQLTCMQLATGPSGSKGKKTKVSRQERSASFPSHASEATRRVRREEEAPTACCDQVFPVPKAANKQQTAAAVASPVATTRGAPACEPGTGRYIIRCPCLHQLRAGAGGPCSYCFVTQGTQCGGLSLTLLSVGGVGLPFAASSNMLYPSTAVPARPCPLVHNLCLCWSKKCPCDACPWR